MGLISEYTEGKFYWNENVLVDKVNILLRILSILSVKIKYGILLFLFFDYMCSFSNMLYLFNERFTSFLFSDYEFLSLMIGQNPLLFK